MITMREELRFLRERMKQIDSALDEIGAPTEQPPCRFDARGEKLTTAQRVCAVATEISERNENPRWLFDEFNARPETARTP